MERDLFRVHHGKIIDEEDDITLIQLCNYCRIGSDRVIEMVEEGLLDPRGRSKSEWRFEFTSVERVKKAERLSRDFQLSLPGAALVIDLLERIDELERLLNIDPD